MKTNESSRLCVCLWKEVSASANGGQLVSLNKLEGNLISVYDFGVPTSLFMIKIDAVCDAAIRL